MQTPFDILDKLSALAEKGANPPELIWSAKLSDSLYLLSGKNNTCSLVCALAKLGGDNLKKLPFLLQFSSALQAGQLVAESLPIALPLVSLVYKVTIPMTISDKEIFQLIGKVKGDIQILEGALSAALKIEYGNDKDGEDDEEEDKAVMKPPAKREPTAGFNGGIEGQGGINLNAINSSIDEAFKDVNTNQDAEDQG